MKPLGIILILSSILSLIFLDVLFLKFIASAIIFITIYYLFYLLFLFITRKPISIKLAQGAKIDDNYNSELSFEIINLPVCFIGFFRLLSFSLSNNNFDGTKKDLGKSTHISKRAVVLMDKISLVLDRADKRKVTVDLKFLTHGYSYYDNFYIYIDDIFGFFRVRFKVNYSTKLFFEPNFNSIISMKNEVSNIGDKIIKSAVKSNSSDYFESRKYYPGDDIRRINWKVFAHSSELHIREIEKSEPFSEIISIIFAPYSKNIREYEFLSSLFYFTVRDLLFKGFKVKVTAPSGETLLEEWNDGLSRLQHLLNNSYSAFSDYNFSPSDEVIVFATLNEYKTLLENAQTKIKYSIISYIYNNENIKTILSASLKIDRHSTFAGDLFDKYKKIAENRAINKKLSYIKDLSNERNISLELYSC